MRPRALVVGLVLLLFAACPRDEAPRALAGDPAAVGSGTLDLLVVDEKDRPIEGAVAWALGTKDATPAPSEPLRLEQKGLEFVPRFLVARKGQKLLVTNDDPETHNVHSADAACHCNEMVPIGGSKALLLDQAGEVTFLCDIHAHMRCTLLVLDTIHARTDASGHARLELPLGPRKLRVRALDKEREELEVTVAASTSAKVVLKTPPHGPLVVAPEKLPWPAVAAHLREGLEDAVRRARAGDGKAAREAVEEAVGTWYAQLHQALLDEKGRAFAKEQQSEVKGLAREADEAAGKGGAALDALAAHVKTVADLLLDIARALPKR